MILTIGGLPAWGKTTLRRLCNSHPKVAITEEFHSFYRFNVTYGEHIRGLRKAWYKYPLVGEPESSKTQMHLRNVVFLARYLVAVQAYRRVLIQAEHIEGILRRIFPQATVIGDSSSRYLWYVLGNLVSTPSLFPTIIYRDCRDVAGHIAYRRQFLRAWFNNPWTNKHFGTSEKVAQTWVRAIELMERYADQVYTIRYEDLVTDPQTVLTEFGKILGVDPQGFAHQIVHTNEVGNYKRWLSDEDVATILSIAGPTMERLGYNI